MEEKINFTPIQKQETINFTPLSKVESKIAGRESYVQKLGKQIKDDGEQLGVISPVGSFSSMENLSNTGELFMNALGSYGQLTEAPFANIAIDLQKGFDIQDLGMGGITSTIGKTGKAIKEGITGERVGEYGDVYRNLGMPESMASTMGFITASALDPLQLKQLPFKGIDVSTKNMGRAIKKASIITSGQKPKVKVDFAERGRRIIGNMRDKFTTFSDKLRLQKDFAINSIKGESDILLKELDDVVGIDARATQEALVNFSKKNSEIYGQYLKSISKQLNKRNPIEAGELRKAFDGMVKNIIDEGYVGTKSMDEVYNFTRKYDGLQATDNVNFEGLADDFKKVKNAIQRDINTGKITPDSLAAQTFKQSMDTFIDGRVPGWKELQQKYGKVLELQKKAGSIFKQGKGQYYTNEAETFLKKVAEDAISGGERAFVDDLQKGIGGFSEGLGDIAKREKILTSKIALNKASINDIEEYYRIKRSLETKDFKRGVEATKRRVYEAGKLKAQKNKNILKKTGTQVAKITLAIMAYGIIRKEVRDILGEFGGGGAQDNSPG